MLISKGCSTKNYEVILPDNILYSSKVLSHTANWLYGWSYPVYGGSRAIVYTGNKDLDGLTTPLRILKYLENYNTKLGFNTNGFPLAERVICDYLLYPKELGADIWLCEALEGYIEDNDDFSKVVEMANSLNVSIDLLNSYIDSMYIGCNE